MHHAGIFFHGPPGRRALKRLEFLMSRVFFWGFTGFVFGLSRRAQNGKVITQLGSRAGVIV